MPGISEAVIILIALAIFFFGADKLSDLAKGLGRFTGEFKRGKDEIVDEFKKTKDQMK